MIDSFQVNGNIPMECYSDDDDDAIRDISLRFAKGDA